MYFDVFHFFSSLEKKIRIIDINILLFKKWIPVSSSLYSAHSTQAGATDGIGLGMCMKLMSIKGWLLSALHYSELLAYAEWKTIKN